MILLLGKNELVEKYANTVLKINMGNDIVYYPDVNTHYSDYSKYIQIAKDEEPPVITTQNMEMIDILLNSDLDINEVITVIEKNGELKTRKLTKEKAKQVRKDYNLELR